MTANKFAPNYVTIVNQPEEEIMDLFFKAIDSDSLQELLDSDTLEEIGNGACGTVYKISDKYALKLNNLHMSKSAPCRDGQLLESLQGLPMIPTLYAYTEDNFATLIQLIDGVNVGDLWRGRVLREYKELNLEFNTEESYSAVVEFYNGALERGIIPNDLHNENVMLDRQGKLWVVDVGLFKDAENSRYAEGPQMVLRHVERVVETFNFKLVPMENYLDLCNEFERPEAKASSLSYCNRSSDKLTSLDSGSYATGSNDYGHSMSSYPTSSPLMDTGDLMSILGDLKAGSIAKPLDEDSNVLLLRGDVKAIPVKFNSFEKNLLKQYTSKRVHAMLVKTLTEGSF